MQSVIEGINILSLQLNCNRSEDWDVWVLPDIHGGNKVQHSDELYEETLFQKHCTIFISRFFSAAHHLLKHKKKVPDGEGKSKKHLCQYGSNGQRIKNGRWNK